MAKKPNQPVRTPSAGTPQSQGRQSSSQIVGVGVNFSGPLPPPAVLQGYEQIKPGYADRIMGWAEEQGRHRRRMEWRGQTIESICQIGGLVFGFLLVAGGLAGAVFLLHEGKKVEGLGTLIGAMVPLVAAFFIARKRTNS